MIIQNIKLYIIFLPVLLLLLAAAGCGGNGSGGDSGGDNDQANESDTTPPTTPVNLQATAISDTRIDLSWDASTDDVGVAGYRIYRDSAELVTTTSTLTSYLNTGLSPSTTYTYTVTAYDAADNESSQSTSANAQTQPQQITTGPVLLFSDLTSGPKTGWEGSATKGAAVTVWGRNFGSTRGTNYITVNGAQVTEYAEWGETRDNARLDAQTQLQRITFFLNNNIPAGDGKIKITIDGQDSNELDFAVSPGRGSDAPGTDTNDIWFIDSVNGLDANNGQTTSFAWKTTSKANPRNNPEVGSGDIVYIRFGTYSVDDGDGAAFKFYGNGGYDGTLQRPRAWIGYPGDEYPVFTLPIVASYRGNADDWMDYVTFAKLKYQGDYGNIFLMGGKGQRIIGVYFNGISQGAARVQAGWITPFGPQDTYYLGNIFKNGGYDNYGHVIYPGCKSAGSSAQDISNLHIGYNEIDNFEGDQAYPYGGAVFNFRNKNGGLTSVDDVYIYNNYMHDSDYAQFFWTEEANMNNYYIYNNLVVGANKNGTHLSDYLLYAQSSGIMHIYSNTFYDGGNARAFVRTKSAAAEAISKNNIYISTGEPFFESTDGTLITSENDIFSGYTTPVSTGTITVTNAITGNPDFVNEAGEDFRLSSGDTVAIDAGTSAVGNISENDLLGNSRPTDGDNSGTAEYDIGAYEYGN